MRFKLIDLCQGTSAYVETKPEPVPGGRPAEAP